MKDHTTRKKIFIDDRKSWTADNILYAFCLAECVDQSGFAATQTPMKCDHFFVADSLPEFRSSSAYVTQFIYDIHSAKIFGELQQGVEDYQLVSRPAGL